MNFKKLACTLLITFQLIGCSTSGGIYKKDDAKDGEFSVGRTALTILGVAAAVAAAKGGGGGYQAQGYACLLYTSPSPRDRQKSRMPSSA